MGEELLLVSQKVIPRNLQKCNYSFKHPHLQDAFAEILYPKN
jgi:NAD dependent epimerase/dehydratase family enzyme